MFNFEVLEIKRKKIAEELTSNEFSHFPVVSEIADALSALKRDPSDVTYNKVGALKEKIKDALYKAEKEFENYPDSLLPNLLHQSLLNLVKLKPLSFYVKFTNDKFDEIPTEKITVTSDGDMFIAQNFVEWHNSLKRDNYFEKDYKKYLSSPGLGFSSRDIRHVLEEVENEKENAEKRAQENPSWENREEVALYNKFFDGLKPWYELLPPSAWNEEEWQKAMGDIKIFTAAIKTGHNTTLLFSKLLASDELLNQALQSYLNLQELFSAVCDGYPILPIWPAEKERHSILLEKIIEKGLNSAEKAVKEALLFWVIEERNVTIVKKLLEQDNDLTKTQNHPFGRTPLIMAAAFSCTDIFEAILATIPPEKHFEQFTIQDISGATVLHWANANIGETILTSTAPENRLELLKIQDKLGNTPLHFWSVEWGRLLILETILKNTPPENLLELLKIQSKNGKTPMHGAATGGITSFFETVLKIIPQEKHLELLTIQDKFKATPLHKAIENIDFNPGETLERSHPWGSFETIEAILKNTSPENLFELLKIQSMYGTTPLHWVVKRKDAAHILETILKIIPQKNHLELLNIKDDVGDTPLQLAREVRRGASFNMIREISRIESTLINEWSDFQWRFFISDTPFIAKVLLEQKPQSLSSVVSKHISADESLQCLAKLLSALQCDKDLQNQIINETLSGGALNDKAQRNLMLWAARVGNDSLVIKLLEQDNDLANRAKTTPVNTTTWTSLAASFFIPRPNTKAPEKQLKLLTIQDEEGNTPLHLASKEGHTKILELLIEKGAKTDVPNKAGKTPQILASENGFGDLADTIDRLSKPSSAPRP